jgi:two-component system, NtrC family, sensor kinase
MRQRGGSEQPVKGRRANRSKARKVSTAAPSMADLQRQIGTLTREANEAREQRTATADILKVISRSALNLQPVLDTLVETAARLCKAERAALSIREGEVYRYVATFAHEEEYFTLLKQLTFAPGRGTVAGRTALEGRAVHIADLAADPEYTGPTISLTIAKTRTALGVPLLRDGVVMGTLTLARRHVEPFSERQIELVQTFADQAVIAIENARLLTETREALERQTATSEVLEVINSCPGDLAPVFDAILEKAHSLCGVTHGSLLLYDGTKFRAVAVHGLSEAFADRLRQGFSLPPNASVQRLLDGGRFVQIRDHGAIDNPIPISRAAFEAGLRTSLFIPLRKDGIPLGLISAARQEVKPFTEKEIGLLESFAAQAVIAIENARLLNELRQRTDDLSESLQQQTATADVLKMIASSPTDVRPVLRAIVESACEICEANDALVALRDGDDLVFQAQHGSIPVVWGRRPINRRWVAGRAVADCMPVHVRDLLAPEGKEFQVGRELARPIGSLRTVLAMPLLQEGESIGAIVLRRTEVHPFSDKQIALLQTFADQAVIAIGNVRLFDEVQARTRDLAESLQQQTATSEVLQIISSSPGELEPVFQAMLENATRVCGAKFGIMNLYDGDSFESVALFNVPPAYAELRKNTRFRANPLGSLGTVIRTKQVAHTRDYRKNPAYRDSDPLVRELVEIAGARSWVVVPMLKEAELIGVITIYRQEIRPFTDKQIELVNNFAKQAVIAIENTRLLKELRESLQQQTATADVLKTISRSTIDLETVLDTLVETVARLCRADDSTMYRRRDDKYHIVAAYGLTEEAKDFLLTHAFVPDRGTLTGRVILEHRAVHISDVLIDPEYTYLEAQKITGYRTMLGIPLLRGDELIGTFTLHRRRVEPFASKEIELATTFADQAVIAIENARLFEELRQSLQQQTATADVLKVISRSTFDLQTVLQTLVESAARLSEADKAAITRQKDGVYFRANFCGFSDEFMDHAKSLPVVPDRGSAIGRALLEGSVVHIPDVQADPDYTFVFKELDDFRTTLAVPMMREGVPIGALGLTRSEVRPFTDKQIELVTTFANQAVIAIENARLFDELRDRQAELRVTFDNMGDGVVMFGADTRLVAWNRNFQEMLELPDAFLAERPSFAEYFRYLADRGEYVSADLETQVGRTIEDTRLEMRYERTRPDGRVIEVRRNPVPGGAFVLIYSDITERKRAEEAIRTARDAAETALRELQAAQDRLVQTEKLASLGQLTAGIAHEIKNPLNFVNNFSALSVELVNEMNAVLELANLDDKKRGELDEIRELLKGNLEKVVQHGKRADSIVKNMLLHSRSGSGEHRPVEINAVIEESLNLAYHGARAEGKDFNISLERDFDPAAGVADVYPQEITRVLLNLISNGFYAATKRAAVSNGFEPKLKAVTRNLGEKVEIRIRDNGTGIPPDIQEKIFNPFFTTKPAGEGTGLGLSMSHDIVVKQHGGTIEVVTEPGSFTEFIITLPRIMPA